MVKFEWHLLSSEYSRCTARSLVKKTQEWKHTHTNHNGTYVAAVAVCGWIIFKEIFEIYINSEKTQDPMGFEPMTYQTQGGCSTDWATRTLKGCRPLSNWILVDGTLTVTCLLLVRRVPNRVYVCFEYFFKIIHTHTATAAILENLFGTRRTSRSLRQSMYHIQEPSQHPISSSLQNPCSSVGRTSRSWVQTPLGTRIFPPVYVYFKYFFKIGTYISINVVYVKGRLCLLIYNISSVFFKVKKL